MARKTQKERVQELTKQMNDSIQNYQTDPEEELELLRYLRQFNNYSVRNIALIQGQYEGAYGVDSYRKHQENGHQVQKGEKAIRILAPRFQDVFRDENNVQQFVSKANKEQKEKIQNNELKVTNDKLVGYISVPVFDITQTDAPENDYPQLYPNKPINYEFEGTEKQFQHFKQAVYDYAEELHIPVEHGKTESAAKGYYSPVHNQIMLRDDLNEREETKVLLHELGHAQMHNKDTLSQKSTEFQSTNVLEYQAEMTAYVVSSTFALDSEDYSQRYLANWTEKDVDNDIYIQSLNEVKDVSNSMIDNIATRYHSLEKEQENKIENNHSNNNLSNKDIAKKMSFLDNENGENQYQQLEDKHLKATEISIQDKEAFKESTVKLESDHNEAFYEKIATGDVDHSTLENWEKGLTGKEWLEEDLKSEILKEEPDMIFEKNISEQEKNDLNNIQEYTQEQELEL